MAPPQTPAAGPVPAQTATFFDLVALKSPPFRSAGSKGPALQRHRHRLVRGGLDLRPKLVPKRLLLIAAGNLEVQTVQGLLIHAGGFYVLGVQLFRSLLIGRGGAAAGSIFILEIRAEHLTDEGIGQILVLAGGGDGPVVYPADGSLDRKSVV